MVLSNELLKSSGSFKAIKLHLIQRLSAVHDPLPTRFLFEHVCPPAEVGPQAAEVGTTPSPSVGVA